MVAALTEEEQQLYDRIDFDLKEYAKDIGATRLLHESKVWHFPIFWLWLLQL